MGRSVFISYSHLQEDWVTDRLVPVLEAGGAEVLIDRDLHNGLRAGGDVIDEMNRLQDRADLSLLVLTPESVASPYCQHEVKRAIAKDPIFSKGKVLPVLRADCVHNFSDVIFVDLRDDGREDAWARILLGCGADLGTSAPAWLVARNRVRRHLERGESVNLVAPPGTRWRELLEHLRGAGFGDLQLVDLQRGFAATRRGLIEHVLSRFGHSREVPPEPRDLAELDRFFDRRPTAAHLGLLYFDMVNYNEDFNVQFYAALRSLQMELRKLVLVVQSRVPFGEFLPKRHPLSSIDIKTVELLRKLPPRP